MSCESDLVDELIARANEMVNGSEVAAKPSKDDLRRIEATLAPVRGHCESTIGTIQRLVRCYQAMMDGDKPAIFAIAKPATVAALRQWFQGAGLGVKSKPAALFDVYPVATPPRTE